MRVLWLTSSYPRHPTDSASVFLRHLAQALSREGIDVHVLAPDHPTVEPAASPVPLHTFRYAFPRRRQKLAYGAGILPNLRRSPWLHAQIPGFVAAMAWAAWRLSHRLRPDLLHAHWILPQGAIATLLGNRLHLPVVITAHGGDAFSLNGRLLGGLKRWTLRHADAWTSNTRTTAAATGSPVAPTVIPMGVDWRRFARADPIPLSEAGDSPIVLFVGRLVEKKGVADLLTAFASLPPSLNARLWIVGDGSERQRLEDWARRLGIAARTRFFGRIPNEALPAYYAAAEVFVAPSVIDRRGDTEGQGVVLLEAMASGTAIVANRVGGIGEVIEDGITGLLAPAGDPAALSGKLAQALNDAALRRRLARRAREKARAYDWPVIARRFAGFYRTLVPAPQCYYSGKNFP